VTEPYTRWLTTTGGVNTPPGGLTLRESLNTGALGIWDTNASVGNSGTGIGGGTFSSGSHIDPWIAFTIGLAPPSTPPGPPPFFPATQPIRAKLPQQPIGIRAFRGRIGSNKGGPLRNPTPGPVFRQATRPSRAKRPQQPEGLGSPRGRVTGISQGAPVNNPTSGPIFRQAVRAIRSIIPQTFSKGRIGSNAGAPIVIPPIIFYELNGVQRHWQSRQPYPNLVSSTPTQPIAVPVKAIIDGYPADLTSSSVQLAFTRGYGLQPSTLIPATWQAGYTAGWHNAGCLVGTVSPRPGRRDIAYGGNLDGLGAGGGRC
jgi:hypothetical protein